VEVSRSNPREAPGPLDELVDLIEHAFDVPRLDLADLAVDGLFTPGPSFGVVEL